MSINEVREPVQKRSIEKKEKIIEAGFNLICKKGYYNTNTAEIAKEAHVSTGIVYQYFKDKHDILLAGISKYADNIFYPMLNISDTSFKKDDLSDILHKMINKFIENHKLSQVAHEEITAMAHSDKDIAKIFYDSEMAMTEKMATLFVNNGFSDKNITEKVHVIMHLIDDLCHEIVYHKHEKMNYDVMSSVVVEMCINILNETEKIN